MIRMDRTEQIIVTMDAGIILLRPHGEWDEAPEVAKRAFDHLMKSIFPNYTRYGELPAK